MIIIVDSGGANIASILFSLKRLKLDAKLSHDPDEIKHASHVILPGVGSIASAMRSLHDYSLLDTIRNLTQPVLGICLGMQLLFDYSAEGNVNCLQIIPGKIKKIVAANLSVPHMGWNQLNIFKKSFLLTDIVNHAYVYFVHSYVAPVNEYTIASANYGEEFAAVVQYKNFYGTQFHPERSSVIGQQILHNFLNVVAT